MSMYFYHLVNKEASIDKGLISLQYMYDNKLYDLFDKNSSKYIKRITDDWNIPKYKNKKSLTREEIIDALNIFRGKYGSNYIYFFLYPPYKALGTRINELSKYKDIYKIDIDNPELNEYITDIFYGYDMSNSDNLLLDYNYYKNISREDYFKKYDDNIPMNFSRLNHIAISFKDGYCPNKFLEKVDWK